MAVMEAQVISTEYLTGLRELKRRGEEKGVARRERCVALYEGKGLEPVDEARELAFLERKAAENHRKLTDHQRMERELIRKFKEKRRSYRRALLQKAVDKLVLFGLLAASVVCFHLLPWWSAVAPAVGAAWMSLRRRAGHEGD